MLKFQSLHFKFIKGFLTRISPDFVNSKRFVSFFKNMNSSDMKKIFVWKDEE